MQKAINKFTNRDVYIIGDFNVNLFDTDEEFLNMMSNAGLLPVICENQVAGRERVA